MTTQTKVQHTPGPWTAESSGLMMAVYAKDGCQADRRIAEMIGPDGEANARLIAAAPDLLEALQDLLTRVDLVLYRGYVGQKQIDAAYAAIAKATGE